MTAMATDNQNPQRQTTKQKRCKKCHEMKPEAAFLKLSAPG